MIACLEGRVVEITSQSCVLLTAGGTGYEIGLPAHTLAALPGKGAVLLYTRLVVREDAQELFGFATWDERQTFLTLIDINRVGARTALAILSVYRPDDLRRLVLEEDATALARVPGIGKKTAQQIFLELKYKLKVDGAPGVQGTDGSRPGGVLHDALTGLANLGYDEGEAHNVLKTVLHDEPDLDVSSALRAALKRLAKKM
ncbi:MAG: Holliday junction branch migration protein RuvA [Deltaproteobacteria bacterium]|jgi:Holliday junction DNA helicase RuvA|nr:Holliday junction branch migration protein RuvA [Deltaproteobacteria bacterium]